METFIKTRIIRVIGPESTGKTTLCHALAKTFHGDVIEEYARKYFETHSINAYTIQDVEGIYQTQEQQEIKAIRTMQTPFLFIDSSFVNAKIWCQVKFNSVPLWMEKAIEVETCDLYLLCKPDITWISDGQRQNAHNRNEIFDQFEAVLTASNKRYKIISGTGDARLENAIEILKRPVDSFSV
jgi:NadR type nicotinamide-nucleotide adenylyltransferase